MDKNYAFAEDEQQLRRLLRELKWPWHNYFAKLFGHGPCGVAWQPASRKKAIIPRQASETAQEHEDRVEQQAAEYLR